MEVSDTVNGVVVAGQTEDKPEVVHTVLKKGNMLVPLKAGMASHGMLKFATCPCAQLTWL